MSLFHRINEATLKPEIWSVYTADVLWTDAHIAKQMLSYHLNSELPLASRSFQFIEQSVNWLVSEFGLDHTSKTIDFGCGPGLYTQALKTKGIGTVIGVDFSQNSLNYATQQAKQFNLDIEYQLRNYLDLSNNLDLSNHLESDLRKFDLISLIMCDLCALSPLQRSILLSKFKSMLEPDGVIALDVYTATRFAHQTETLSLEKNAMNRFWSASDYWCVQSNFKYQPELVTLDKYVIYEDEKQWAVYNWLQHFTVEMLSQELDAQGLKILAIYDDLRGSKFSNGDEMAVIIGHK